MRVDRRIPCGTCQVLVFTIWNVEVSLRVAILLCETEINNVDLVATLSNAHEKVVWLDVTVNKRLGMDVFDT